MKREKAIRFGRVWKRFIAGVLTAMMIAAYMPPAETSAADTGGTGYQVEITERVDPVSGFVHPGLGLTKSIMENVREQVQNQVDPWYSYFVKMSEHAFAATNVTSNNQSSSDPTQPASTAFNSQGFNSRFIQDSSKAYTQALMYFITGEEVYRQNGMRIIRIWEQMDPAQYAYFTDSHIHTGLPLNFMLSAAEIFRYTSTENPTLEWTEDDTVKITNNLITPVINTFLASKHHFMNQHNYPLLGSLAGYIFTDNKAGYEERVEWWSVNEGGNNPGFNGSVKRLFRLIDRNDLTGEPVNPPVVQHLEMGRDQAHAGGDLANMTVATRMLHAQGTKLDPVDGTVSTAPDAVEPMAFLDHRIIKAADYFWQFMLGYDPEWIPAAYSIRDGEIIDTYNRISNQYKGRFLTANFWDFYSYYTYNEGVNIEEIAPYYAEAFSKKQFLNMNNLESGEDFWLYLPAEAAQDAAKFLPPQQPNLAQRNEVEIRYTAFDEHTEKLTEGGIQFIRFNATEEGAKIALLSGGTGQKMIGFKIRSNGIAQLDMGTRVNDTLTLPDTKGQWRYVTYTMNEFQSMGDYFDFKVRGTEGTVVDIDHISFEAAATLEPPVFQSGNADTEIFTYTGVPLNLDFSASGDNIAYDSTGLPQGAQLDGDTGAFTWNPGGVGEYSFIVAASDGTTTTAKNVIIHVSADRASAIAATISPYHANAVYSKASLAQYQAVYDDTIGKSAALSDEQFIQQLLVLRTAVESLQLVSPQAHDGSLDYSRMVSSRMGNSISVLLDGDNDTFAGFTRDPLYHILDFGPGFKVSADAFAVQSRMNFTDRGAGIAIFGSNDSETWTRLTPGETPFNSGLNRLEVAEAYKNEQYRFIKIDMITKHRDVLSFNVQGIMELGEFRIYGERHEIDNKLEVVAFDTTQGLKGRIAPGDTAKLMIKATEEISDVRVKIQGVDATVTTLDQINWTATAVLNNGVATGLVKLTIDYKKKDGTSGSTEYLTTDGSKLLFVDESDVIQNVTGITNLIDSTTNRTPAQTLQQVSYLFDNNLSFSDFRNGSGGAGNGGFITFDFKKGNQVSISSVELLARQDQYYGRIGGTVIQGSNDNSTWTTLTDPAISTMDWQILPSKDKNTLYRYIRIYNGNAWYGNLAEVKFHGQVVSTLSDLLNQAAAIDRSIYTDDSLAVLDTAVSAGEVALADANATQADLNVAIDNLRAALGALAYRPAMPVLELADQTIVANNQLTFEVLAVNVDEGVEVAYETVGELPQGATFNSGTRTFSWTPSVNQGGVYALTFRATANHNASEKTIRVTVIGAPVVDLDDVVEQFHVKVGQNITYSLPVSPDASGKAVAFTAAQLPAGATLNSINGTFRWTPTNADYGAHSITFKASNGDFEVEVPLQIQVELHILPAENYTKASYEVYSNELARIEAELNQPGANKAALALQIAAAEQALVRVPVPVYSVIKDEDGNEVVGLVTDIATGTTGLTAGKFASGRAVSFGGGANDYLQLSANAPFKNYDEITIALWAKWDGGDNWQRIFDFGNNTNQYMFLTPKSGNNTLRFAIKNGGAEQFIQTSTLATNQWVHIAVTLGGGTGKLYVNGALAATGNMSINPSDFKPSVNYIAKSQYPDPLFRGAVDNFTIYNYVLSDEEILTAMNDLQLLEELIITPESLTLEAGSTQALSVTASYADETEANVTANAGYSTSNSTVATVSETGVVTAVAAGTATITVTFGGASTTVEVVVGNGQPQPQASLTGTNEARAGEDAQLTVGVESLDANFTILDVVVHYDPSKLEFELEGQSLAAGAVQAEREGLELLGTAVKPDMGKIKVIMAATSPLSGDGALFSLQGKVKADAEPGAATISLSDFEISLAGQKSTVATDEVQLIMTVIAADRAALSEAIDDAQALHNAATEGTSAGQYPYGNKAILQTAINTAKGVRDNATATQAQINAALAALNQAVSTFAGSVIVTQPGEPGDKTELAALIQTVQNLYDKSAEGAKVGQYAIGSKTALHAALQAAKAVRDQSGATQSAINQAVASLQAAVQAFSAQMVTLVPGATRITIRDLSVMMNYFGVTYEDESWSEIEAADVLNKKRIDIQTLAAVARMILTEWLED